MDLGWLHTYADRWHDTWEIVGAVFTALAVVVALGFGLHDSRTRAKAQREELDRLRDERDEARRERIRVENNEARRRREEQARLVVIRVSEYYPRPAPMSVDVQIYNFSDMPVFDVVARVHDAVGGEWRSSQPQLAPGGSMASTVTVPDASRGTRIAEDTEVEFVDVAGNKWVRRADTFLVELLPEPDPAPEP